MLSPVSFRRLYRLSAVYDLVLSAPFAVAPVAALAWAGADGVARAMHLAPLPPLAPHAMMFANFFGTIVTLWGLLRLRLDLPALARWDAFGRLSFALAMGTALVSGASPLLWPILLLELVWAAVQLAPVTGWKWSNCTAT